MSNRLKVVVGAYACNPTLGSEHAVGWGWVEAISRYHDLWIITAADNRSDIEAELNRRPYLAAPLHFEYVTRTRDLRLEKIAKLFYLRTYKHQWLASAYKRAVELHAQIDFDLAHQLTYIGFRFPGHLWKLGIPFVWGPVGGLEQTTWRLLPALGFRGAAYYLSRNLLNDFDRRFRVPPKQAFLKGSGGIIAATTGIAREIQRFYGVPSVVIPEVGIPPRATRTPTKRAAGTPLRLIWSGNHLPGKALPLLLKALGLVQDTVDWRLTVLGSGPCTRTWREISKERGIDHLIEWSGQLSRDNALALMQQSHALVISSVYDLTSTVLVEALANGLPVVCPDHCGFKDAIDDTCGIKVAATNPRVLIHGLAKAVVCLSDESVRFRLASAAVLRSRVFEWGHKGEVVDQIYKKLAASSTSPCTTTI